MNRGILTIILGSVGILFSIFGILQHIVGFLLILGVAVPPIGGVLIVDYFLLARDRQSLAVTRASNSLPPSSESVNPVALLAWLAGFLVGESLHIGVASVNSIIAAGIVYYAVMKAMAILSKRPIKYFRTVPTTLHSRDGLRFSLYPFAVRDNIDECECKAGCQRAI